MDVVDVAAYAPLTSYLCSACAPCTTLAPLRRAGALGLDFFVTHRSAEHENHILVFADAHL